MTTHTHQTAPTQFVEANGIRFGYRRFGSAGAVPLVFNQHFTGMMDNWDPAVTKSEAGQAAGREFLKRFRLRSKDRDPDVNEKVAPAQLEAIGKWGAPQKSFDYLKSIKQPTLVVNGSKDVIVYTANSFILQQNLPNAQLILYPDASHGSRPMKPAGLPVTRYASMAARSSEFADTNHHRFN